MSREDLDPKAWIDYNEGQLHFTDATSTTSTVTANSSGLVLNGNLTGSRLYTANPTPLLDGELISKSHLDSRISSHTHDDRYYTETELDAGQLDNRYYTETEINARFNTSTGHDHDGTDSKKVDHLDLLNIGSNSHATIDSHISNSTIHFTKGSLGDLSVTSGLGTHTGDTTIHFTEGSIDHTAIQNIGSNTHAQIDGKIVNFNSHTGNATIHFTEGSIDHTAIQNIGSNSHAQIDNKISILNSHTGDASIHFVKASLGDLSVTSGLGTHTGDATIHFTEGSIDHTAIQNIGSNSHAVIDGKITNFNSHTGDATIHFTEGSIDHTSIQNIGSNSHAQIDGKITNFNSHTGDATIHFTEGSIDHTAIQNIGSNSHAVIDGKITNFNSHTGDATIHYEKSSIALNDLSGVVISTLGTDQFFTFNGTNWVNKKISGTTHSHNTSALTAGTLGIVRGGTNATSFTNTRLIYYNGSSLASSIYNQNSYALTGQLGSHTGNATIHFTRETLGDLSVTSGLGTHTADTTIHFTEGSIDHTSIQNIGLNTHDQIDGKITNFNSHTGDATIHFTEGSIDHTAIQNVGSNTHAQIDNKISILNSHTGDSTIHFTESSIDHTAIQNIGLNSHVVIDGKIDDFESHTGDATIHFTEGSIDHANIQNIGSNTHAQIDGKITDFNSHTGDATIHFTEGSIDHTSIQNIGLNSHAVIDGKISDFESHTGDATIHFTEGSIDHTAIQNIGSNTHDQIDNKISILNSHTADTTIHFVKSDIVLSDLTNVDASSTSTWDVLTWNGSVWDSVKLSGASHEHDASAITSGTLGIVRGGTNQTTYTDLHFIYYNGTSLVSSDYKYNSYALTGQLGTHTADTTIHFTEGAIDHTNILSIGTNTHAQIDSHISDGSIHFAKSDINLDDLGNVSVGSPSHNDLVAWGGAGWVNIGADTITGSASGDTSSTGSANLVAYFVDAHNISGDSNFVFDEESDKLSAPIISGTVTVSGARFYMTTSGLTPQIPQELTTKFYVDTLSSSLSSDYVSLLYQDNAISGSKFFMNDVNVGLSAGEYTSYSPTLENPQLYVKVDGEKYGGEDVVLSDGALVLDTDSSRSSNSPKQLFAIRNNGIKEVPLNSSIRAYGVDNQNLTPTTLMGNCTKVQWLTSSSTHYWDKQKDGWGTSYAEFSATTDQFTATVSGVYNVTVSVTVNSDTQDANNYLQALTLLIYKNGDPFSSNINWIDTNFTYSTPNSVEPLADFSHTISITDLIPLDVADYIEIYIANQCKGGNNNLNIVRQYDPCTEPTSSDASFLAVVKVL